MSSDEVQFLRDQVQRLNGVLAQYQEKYPPIGFTPQLDGRADGPPWYTDKSVLSPLLKEYDANIQALQNQVDEYQQSQKELRTQADKLVAENKRLHRELQEAVRSQLGSLDVDLGDSHATPLPGDDQLLLNLQQQLQMSLQEKESVLEMWQAACHEVERLEQNTQGHGFDPRLQSLETQANQIKHQYVKTVNELNKEIASLHEDLASARTELKASQIQVTDLRHTLQEMKGQLLRKEQEKTLVVNTRQVVEEKVEEVSHDVQTLQTKVQDKARELATALEEKRGLQNRYLELQKKSTENEQREYEAVLKVRDSMQMAENALLEKDQAMVREQQALDQVEKLQQTIGTLLDEAGARTRKEVDNVKAQCNENLARLMEEIHHLEMESSERQAQLDRAIREKRAVESELEKLYQEGIIKGTKDGAAYEDMNRRACHAERLRQEAETKLDATTNQLKRLEASYLDEKQHLQQELEQLKDRMEAVSDEFETINEDRVKFLEEIDGLKRQLQTASQEKDASQRNYTKQLTCMERDAKLKAQEYEVRLQTLEDSHRQAMMDLRQMLTSQQRMSAKWKEECQTITHKFEVKVGDLRSEVTRLKDRNNELTKLLKESQEKTKEAGLMLAEYTRNIQRMEDRVREAENRANTASAQISKQMSKARNLMYATSVPPPLASSNRSFGAPDPLNLSDLQGVSKNGVTFSGSTRGGMDDDNRDDR